MSILTRITAVAPDAEVTETQSNRVVWLSGIVFHHVTLDIPTTEHHRTRQAQPVLSHMATTAASL